MDWGSCGYSNSKFSSGGGSSAMDDTHQYVEKLHDTQKKAEKNKHRGQGSPEAKLSNKQHSTKK
jgi:hypothetical protein